MNAKEIISIFRTKFGFKGHIVGVTVGSASMETSAEIQEDVVKLTPAEEEQLAYALISKPISQSNLIDLFKHFNIIA